MSTLFIKNARIKDNDDLVNISIHAGRITEIQPATEGNTNNLIDTTIIDVEGNVVTPPFIESHIHPDKAFLEERLPNQSGTLEEAIQNTAELKKKYEYTDVKARSERVIQWALSHGTTTMRVHPDVDPFEKLMGVEVFLELKEIYKGIMDLQIVVFPQEGILKSPGVYDLMVEGIELGADVVGACPYVEESVEDAKKHIDIVFDLAEQYNLPVDMHVDFSDSLDDPRYMLTEYIADQTIRREMQGKVALGHVTTLGAMADAPARALFDKIAEAGITIIPLPATDLYLNGRHAEKDIPRGMAPVLKMMEHGINVVYASNNIRNGFTPFGNGNLLLVGYLLAETQHMGSAQQKRTVIDMITTNAAKALGMEEHYGLEVGKPADMVVFQSKQISDLIQDQPLPLYVIKNGEIIIQNKLETVVSPYLQKLKDHLV